MRQGKQPYGELISRREFLKITQCLALSATLASCAWLKKEELTSGGVVDILGIMQAPSTGSPLSTAGNGVQLDNARREAIIQMLPASSRQAALLYEVTMTQTWHTGSGNMVGLAQVPDLVSEGVLDPATWRQTETHGGGPGLAAVFIDSANLQNSPRVVFPGRVLMSLPRSSPSTAAWISTPDHSSWWFAYVDNEGAHIQAMADCLLMVPYGREIGEMPDGELATYSGHGYPVQVFGNQGWTELPPPESELVRWKLVTADEIEQADQDTKKFPAFREPSAQTVKLPDKLESALAKAGGLDQLLPVVAVADGWQTALSDGQLVEGEWQRWLVCDAPGELWLASEGQRFSQMPAYIDFGHADMLAGYLEWVAPVDLDDAKPGLLIAVNDGRGHTSLSELVIDADSAPSEIWRLPMYTNDPVDGEKIGTFSDDHKLDLHHYGLADFWQGTFKFGQPIIMRRWSLGNMQSRTGARAVDMMYISARK